MEKALKKTAEKIEADVVIIGGGGAGLSAALSAGESGAKKVIVLEKASAPGGNAAAAHGLFCIESAAQKRQGIVISADKLIQARMEEAECKIDPLLTRDLIRKSKDILAWLEKKGLVFNHVIALGGSEGFENGEDVPRVFHMYEAERNEDKAVGPRIIQTLVKDCRESGVQLWCAAAAKKIFTDENGQVKGVQVKTGAQTLDIAAKSVIIAAGGFARSRKLIKRYFPLAADVYTNSLPQLTGDGIIMAEAVGAMKDDQVGIGFIGPHHYPWSMSLNLLLRRPQTLLVNTKGERYIGSPRKGGNNALSRQPGQVCYVLLDADMLRDIREKKEVCGSGEESMGDNGAWLNTLEDDLKKESGEGYARIAGTWDGIAAYIGAEPEVLKATIERYNSFCAKGYDPDFLKDPDLLIPLSTPPFYAVLGRQGFDSTMGGIKINPRMEVIDKQSNPIGGLYAAGDNAAGFLTAGYKYPGQALTFALYSGYAAGENAAKYVRERNLHEFKKR